MPEPCRCWRLAGLVLAAVFVTGCASRLPLDKPWIEVRTQHFTITSAMSEQQTVELARDLEIFRAGVLLLTNVESLDSPIPIRIYFFDSDSTFRAFRPGRYVRGYFMPSVRACFVAIVETPGVDTDRILKHEYVHFLLRSESTLIPPSWYDEGFAELLSTMEIRNEYLAVGALPEDRIRQLRFGQWIPLYRVMEYDWTQQWEPAEVAMFYAQSWALVHYLTRDHERRLAMTNAMNVYTKSIREGAPQRRASEAAFERTTAELDAALRDYLRRGSFSAFGIPLDRLEWSPESNVRSLTRAELAVRLGELSLQRREMKSAQALFEAALAEDPGHARAHAGLGAVQAQAGLWEEAQAHFERAVDTSPDDPLNQLDLGGYWHARAQKTDDADLRRKMLHTARRHYARGMELDTGKPEPYALYGASFLVDGEDPGTGIEALEHAARLLPSDIDTRLYLAEAYVGVGRGEDARPILRSILTWAGQEETGVRARELLEELGGESDSHADLQ